MGRAAWLVINYSADRIPFFSAPQFWMWKHSNVCSARAWTSWNAISTTMKISWFASSVLGSTWATFGKWPATWSVSYIHSIIIFILIIIMVIIILVDVLQWCVQPITHTSRNDHTEEQNKNYSPNNDPCRFTGPLKLHTSFSVNNGMAEVREPSNDWRFIFNKKKNRKITFGSISYAPSSSPLRLNNFSLFILLDVFNLIFFLIRLNFREKPECLLFLI